MAKIYPFRALRYDTNKVSMEDVVTQPYDKITPEMQQAYYDRSRYNLIRVILGKKEPDDTDAFAPLPEGETPQQTSTPAPPSRSSPGAKRASSAKKPSPPSTATPRPTPSPARPKSSERRGFIALGHLYDYADQVVYRHEQTFPKHKSDRLALFKATRAYCEQIYMLYSDPAFTAESLIFDGKTEPPPTWKSPTSTTSSTASGSSPTPTSSTSSPAPWPDKKLIIADGHHRYETSVTYMHERAAELGITAPCLLTVILRRRRTNPQSSPKPTTPPNPNPSSPAFPEAAMMMTFVNMDAPGITILPTHRVLFNIGDFPYRRTLRSPTPPLTSTSPSSKSAPDRRRTHRHGVAFIVATRRRLPPPQAKPEAIAPASRELHPEITDRQAQLDVVQLHRLVLEAPPPPHPRLHRQPRKHPLHPLRRRSRRAGPDRQADIAFLIKPVTLQQLKDISLSGDVMPQKSTDFYPKLLSGLAIYALD